MWLIHLLVFYFKDLENRLLNWVLFDSMADLSLSVPEPSPTSELINEITSCLIILSLEPISSFTNHWNRDVLSSPNSIYLALNFIINNTTSVFFNSIFLRRNHLIRHVVYQERRPCFWLLPLNWNEPHPNLRWGQSR